MVDAGGNGCPCALLACLGEEDAWWPWGETLVRSSSLFLGACLAKESSGAIVGGIQRGCNPFQWYVPGCSRDVLFLLKHGITLYGHQLQVV